MLQTPYAATYNGTMSFGAKIGCIQAFLLNSMHTRTEQSTTQGRLCCVQLHGVGFAMLYTHGQLLSVCVNNVVNIPY